MKAITKPERKKEKLYHCPTCAKRHMGHPEFGCFCCASCLQTVVRPLIVTLTEGQNKR